MTATKRPPARHGDPGDPDRIDPLAMTVKQAAKILSAMGVGRVTQKMIRRHIAAGAPVLRPSRGAGRINLVHYAAWLNQHLGRDDHAA